MSDLWVFGYGSLMWRPGFDYVESHTAVLYGLHRSLCVYSWVHRGTQEKPGLVLGLDRGGTCRGMAYRVAESRGDEVVAYLRAREQVTKVYVETSRPIHLEAEGRPVVRALVYTVDRTHPQYAGVLPREELLRLVAGGRGISGINRDYVISTVAELDRIGIRDETLSWLAARLRERAPG